MNWSAPILILAWVTSLAGTAAAQNAVGPRQTEVSLLYNYSALDVASGTEGRLYQLSRANPGLVIREWTGLPLSARSGRAALMMAIAGDAGPDLFVDGFDQISTDVHHGVLYPLNEWIGQDLDHNGTVDEGEARWPGWKDVDPLWKRIATVDGKIYGLPIQSSVKFGIVFRKDLARRAGLDPDRPPRTWDEFKFWCRRLTRPEQNQYGFAFLPDGSTWVPWMQAEGGTPVVQRKRSPRTGELLEFPMDEGDFRVASTGEDLAAVIPDWQARFDSPPGLAALSLMHQLRWQPWIRDPADGNPIELTPQDLARGRVRRGSGEVSFRPSDVITGCSRPAIPGFAQRGVLDMLDWLTRGEVGMMQIFIDNLPALGTINPDVLGTFPIPAGPDGKPVVGVTQAFLVMSRSVGHRDDGARQLVWRTMATLTDREAFRAGIRNRVFSGSGKYLTPEQLTEAGLGDYLAQIPADAKRLNQDLKAGRTVERVPPFVGAWDSMDLAMQQNVLSPMLSPSGADFDYRAAMTALTEQANRGGMFRRAEDQLAAYRPRAYAIAAVVVLILGAGTVVFLRRVSFAPASGGGRRRATLTPLLMLAPAVATVLLWRYYPLAKGLGMAFEDHHLASESRWVGLDNFITVFLNPDFYIFLRQTAKFVVLNFLLVFAAPIVLALLLTEVRRGKFFWRLLYFLPQLSSGMVIALLWKLMYDPTPGGILNHVLALLGLGPQDWLGNPRTAMLSTILPALWASAGYASLIYIAALQTIPDEFYEAAEVDGAGLLTKLRHVTFPMLAPLILINFVGTFIGTFQGMGNIFLLTFGGPGKETMVLSMAIWIEAYNNLNFSVATTMAWVMGAGLLFMTYWQVRLLGRVEFRQSKG